VKQRESISRKERKKKSFFLMVLKRFSIKQKQKQKRNSKSNIIYEERVLLGLSQIYY
jgi:hypothetical protein